MLALVWESEHLSQSRQHQPFRHPLEFVKHRFLIMSKTKDAIKYLNEHPGCSPYRAAQLIGLTPSVLYRAINKKPQEVCPCCGQRVFKQVEPMEPD
ncbi:MAG: AsnC-type helix-turn-helix domain protein [Podoviridae sp. ctQNx1]|nr:MAG: AsnC-type helix-turn-helix domain protein [Podoviridae sp. ctQNx1]UOF78115.1 asnC-type helix-turn-helix domain [Caudoviricetes sp.]